MDTSKANTKRGSKQQTAGSSYSFFTLFALPLPLSVQSFVRVCFLFLVNWSRGSRIPLQVSETLLSPRRAHASTARPSSLNIPISPGLVSFVMLSVYLRAALVQTSMIFANVLPLMTDSIRSGAASTVLASPKSAGPSQSPVNPPS